MSGNLTKKWNKFDCYCMSFAGLPIEHARKVENIHFVACSNRVFAVEMAQPIVDDLLKLEAGVEMYDTLLETNTLVIAKIMFPL